MAIEDSKNFVEGGLDAWNTSDSGKFLADNMRYMMQPQYQKASEGIYSRGFGRSTMLGEAHEPIQRAQVSGLGDVLNDLYFRDKSANLEREQFEYKKTQDAFNRKMLKKQYRQDKQNSEHGRKNMFQKIFGW